MEIISQVVGWVGTALIVVAYFLNSTNRISSSSNKYQLLNLLGAIGVGFNVFYQAAWPAFVLQVTWGIIAILSIVKRNKINMNINKKFLISIIVFLILVIIGGIVYINKSNQSSFIVKIRGDLTSSGAQRDYYASLVFVDNVLTEGEEAYYVGQGGGCTTNCERINGCKILNGEWVDMSDESNCKIDYPFVPSTTKSGIEEQIRSKELKPMNKCGHLDMCYEILDISHINDGRPGGPGGSMGHRDL